MQQGNNLNQGLTLVNDVWLPFEKELNITLNPWQKNTTKGKSQVGPIFSSTILLAKGRKVFLN
jgi:hypothetical protein